MPVKRIVIDTNVLISHALMANSRTGQLVSHLLENHKILYSASTLAERSSKRLARPSLARQDSSLRC